MRDKITPLIKCTFMIVLVLFSLMSGYYILNYKNLRIHCTEKVDAQIIDIQSESKVDNSGKETSENYNVYIYTYDGKLYTEQSQDIKRDKYEIGTQIQIRVNPDNPKEFVEETIYISNKILTMFMGIIILVFVGTIIAVIVATKQMKKEANSEDEKEVEME